MYCDVLYITHIIWLFVFFGGVFSHKQDTESHMMFGFCGIKILNLSFFIFLYSKKKKKKLQLSEHLRVTHCSHNCDPVACDKGWAPCKD